MKKKGLAVVLEELKQRILAKTGKIKRYQSRIEQYRHNRMFQSNQKRLFEMLENEERDNSVVPDTEESIRFWSSIWDNPVSHNTGAEWLKDVENELVGVQKQNDIMMSRWNRIPFAKKPGKTLEKFVPTFKALQDAKNVRDTDRLDPTSCFSERLSTYTGREK